MVAGWMGSAEIMDFVLDGWKCGLPDSVFSNKLTECVSSLHVFLLKTSLVPRCVEL